MASKGAQYMKRRRAEGKAWDQQPRNREKVRERQRRWVHDLRWRRVDAGLCTNCGQPAMSDWYCWDCLGKRQDRYLGGIPEGEPEGLLRPIGKDD
jgi:hypothetical protein